MRWLGLLVLLGCGDRKPVVDASPMLGAAVPMIDAAPLPAPMIDAAPLPAPTSLARLDAVQEPAWPAKQRCGAYLEAAREMWRGVGEARQLAAARDVAGLTAAGARLREVEARLRPAMPGEPTDLPVVHSALMSAIDRVARGCEAGGKAMPTGDQAGWEAAEAAISAGSADLEFALGKLIEICAGS